MAVIETQVPDTITSWVASAFAVNSQTGFGVAPYTASVYVLFVIVNLSNLVYCFFIIVVNKVSQIPRSYE